MPFIAANYLKNINAPIGQWVCTRTSSILPSAVAPSNASRHGPNFCGQCVSFVATVCANLLVNTKLLKKGLPVKDNKDIVGGTAIATFDTNRAYVGHAAIYVTQSDAGISVYDQWVTGIPQPIHKRIISWKGSGVANNGNGFFVVEPF